MAISAKTKMTAKVLMVAKSRAIEARSVKHRGEQCNLYLIVRDF